MKSSGNSEEMKAWLSNEWEFPFMQIFAHNEGFLPHKKVHWTNPISEVVYLDKKK